MTLTPVANLPEHEVKVRAPGKINLSLRVGRRQDDGYHPLSTVFQAVSVFEEVVATPAEGRTLTVSGPQADLVPTDATNLALRAADLVAARAGIDEGVHLHLFKGVPVAGGMAGGSADAAAALLACDALWRTGLSRDELLELAAQLGSDVPFALAGHTAVGTGRGHLLTPALSRGEFHWAFAVQDSGLSTARVFAEFDEISDALPTPDAADDVPLMQALRAGDPRALGAALHNDLQLAALSLEPGLAEPLAVAQDAGALGVVLSGSGPTVAALGRSRQHALVLAAAFTAAGVADRVLTAAGPVAGARVVSSTTDGSPRHDHVLGGGPPCGPPPWSSHAQVAAASAVVVTPPDGDHGSSTGGTVAGGDAAGPSDCVAAGAAAASPTGWSAAIRAHRVSASGAQTIRFLFFGETAVGMDRKMIRSAPTCRSDSPRPARSGSDENPSLAVSEPVAARANENRATGSLRVWALSSDRDIAAMRSC